MTLKALLLLILAYLLGSVPFGVIVTRLFSNVEVTKAGSKNIGAYNVFRLTGARLGLVTLAGDFLKGAVPVWLGMSWLGMSDWKGLLWISLVALAAFLGHLFSVFLGFKGGKGVATAAGCFLILSPMAFLVGLLVYILVVCSLGYSSAGSLSATAVLPFVVWLDSHSPILTTLAAVITVIIYIKHTDNIRRLLEGTEHSSFRT
ncbi:MAG: glycerol-3-phosphate 1-O-acyltransferase PlsY [Deltaproteobacteria bacterium]|nr:glycerol-3-phosphate 1-O-acyltransferase PlsY [Deltaproteobacteria bacterium]